RGEVVHYAGRLTRVRRFETPKDIYSAYGIKYHYEGWIFDAKVSGANPMCVLFTELPPAIEIGEQMNIYVVFDGYFFKTWKYTGGDHVRVSPILIGRMPIVKTPPDAGKSNTYITMSSELVTAFLGFIVLVIVLVIGLSVWYRRGDRRTRMRLAETNAATFFDADKAPTEITPSDNGSHGVEDSGNPLDTKAWFRNESN